jgi:nucleotide-binding universal stress UspA family protein
MGATAVTQSSFTATAVTIRNILFATDFSDSSAAALPVAIALARRYGAALFVTHVLPPEPRYELPIESASDAINPRKLEAQQHFDALIASGVLNDVVHEPILRSGDFWGTLQDVMATRSIDLIVAGTHGRQGLRKLLMGSVAEKIFRLAACPVVTVGPHAKFPADGMHHILFATDFSLAANRALPYAYSLAEREGAQLTLLNVVQPAPPAVDAVVMPVLEADMAEDARRHLLDIVDAYPPPLLKPEVLVMNGTAAETIVYAAAERGAAMIVLGVRHKSSAATHYPWSIADAVASGAHCPVLTVRGT